jgi:putative copper resistance protein D
LTAVHAGALLFAFGSLALPRLLGRAPHSGLRRPLLRAAALALAAGALWPLAQTAVALDDAAAAFDPAQVAVVLTQTRFGQLWLARWLLLVGALAWAWRARAGAGLPALALFGTALASLGWIGHAGGAGPAVQAPVLALHLLAAGAWLGALPWLLRLARELPAPEMVRCLQRFSAVGLALVALVLASGALSAAWRLGSVAALLHEPYGHWLLWKIGAVALMGAVALRNRNVHTPALARAPDGAAAERARAGLRRSVALETGLGAAVVLLAVLLAGAEAPH